MFTNWVNHCMIRWLAKVSICCLTKLLLLIYIQCKKKHKHSHTIDLCKKKAKLPSRQLKAISSSPFFSMHSILRGGLSTSYILIAFKFESNQWQCGGIASWNLPPCNVSVLLSLSLGEQLLNVVKETFMWITEYNPKYIKFWISDRKLIKAVFLENNNKI